ncbi:hypothetical protein ACFXTO_015779 [Malus domestica]
MAIHEAKCDNKWSDTTTTSFHHRNHRGGYLGSEVHGAFTTAQAMPSKAHGIKATTEAMSLQAQRELNALPSRAQASHPYASHSEQSAPVEQPTLVTQPAPAEQPIPVAQLAPTEQPTFVAQPAFAAQYAPVAFQVAQIDPRLVQPSWFQISGPTIEPGAFSPHLSSDLTFPNSTFALGVYHTSIAQEDTFIPSYSNPNGEQHLSRQVIKLLTSALAQQTTLVNQLLQCTEM